MAGASYSIKKNRIQRGWHPGWILEEDETLRTDPKQAVHLLYLRAIDGGEKEAFWGRLHMQAAGTENMVSYLYAAAFDEDSFYRNQKPVKIEDFLCDPNETHAVKHRFLKEAGFLKFVNQTDVLLYELQGRYLYLVLEVMGEGMYTVSRMQVDRQGDPFMQTFPEIYQEKNSFFHRYLSVFSSIYQDFQERIEDLPKLLDLDTCPCSLLPVYASWLGLDVGENFLEEETLRTLVKEAFALGRIKGTKAALEQIAQILLKENVLVIERNVMSAYIQQEQLEQMNRLYGQSVHDVTILVHTPLTEVKKSQLLFLMEQFCPIRSRLHIVCLKKSSILDSYTYLDLNAQIPWQGKGSLDEARQMDGSICLI